VEARSGSPELGTTFDTRGKTMKKVLLATTALVLSAGVASAEIAFSGNARMGLQNNDGVTSLEKRMTVNITGTAETTSGITFGAMMRLRSEEDNATAVAGARVYMQSNGVEVGAGNINGAIESMPGLYNPSVGLTGLGWGGIVTNVVGADLLGGATDTDGAAYWQWDAYSSTGNGAEGVEVSYSGGGLGAHLSFSNAELSSGASADERLAAYLSYAVGDWTVALGMQESDDDNDDKTVATIGGAIGSASVGLAYADNNGVTKFAVNGSSTFGGTTISAYVADENTAGTEIAYGLGLSHDLGGASLTAGVANTELGITRSDIGVSFSF